MVTCIVRSTLVTLVPSHTYWVAHRGTLWLAEEVHIGVKDEQVNTHGLSQAWMVDHYRPSSATDTAVLLVLMNRSKRSRISHDFREQPSVRICCINQDRADSSRQARCIYLLWLTYHYDAAGQRRKNHFWRYGLRDEMFPSLAGISFTWPVQ